jgi:hypothetical protein
MFDKWTETDRLSHELLNINHVGNEAKDDPSEGFSTVNGTGTGHES